MGRGMIYVFALAQEGNGESGEVARVGEGLEGCVKAEWGKGSRDIMVWSDYGVSGRIVIEIKRVLISSSN